MNSEYRTTGRKQVFIAAALVVAAGVLLIFWNTSREDISDTPQKNVDMIGEGASREPVETTDVEYSGNVKGYFAKPKTPGNYPGVVMIHEWWGLNDNIKEMARQLAGEGYVVLAVDLYNGEVALDAERARQLSGALDQEAAIENMRAAVAFLRGQNAVKIASLGWCFGGGKSLRLALSGEQLDATIIYYGNLVTDEAELRKIQWPVLGIFGGEDQSIPVETVNSFDAALDAAGVKNEMYIYPGVGHAFANPSGASYAPEETKDAWAKTLAFLKTHL